MEKYIYLIIFILFIPIFFTILRAMSIEKYFKNGHELEIKGAYILFSLILASLTTDAISKIFVLL